jgi:hypothetical protein
MKTKLDSIREELEAYRQEKIKEILESDPLLVHKSFENYMDVDTTDYKNPKASWREEAVKNMSIDTARDCAVKIYRTKEILTGIK